MNTPMKTVSALVLLASTAFAGPEVKNDSVDPKVAKEVAPLVTHKASVEKIEIDFIKPPEYSISGTKQLNTTYKKEWMRIEAKLKVENAKRGTILPELKATFYVGHLITEPGKEALGKMQIEIPDQNIDTENGEVWVSAYIDPDTLHAMTKRKNPTKRHLIAVAVSIDSPNLFKEKTAKGTKLISKNVSFKKIKDAPLHDQWFTYSHKAIVASKYLLRNKSQTPFAPLYGDRYPQIAPPVETAKK